MPPTTQCNVNTRIGIHHHGQQQYTAARLFSSTGLLLGFAGAVPADIAMYHRKAASSILKISRSCSNDTVSLIALEFARLLEDWHPAGRDAGGAGETGVCGLER